MKAIDRDCKNCVRRKTSFCPNSKLCYDNLSLPYFQDRIMLLKENEELKRKLYLCTPEIPQNSHRDYISYVDLVNKNYSLEKENQELKKQIEEYKDKIDWYENFEVNKTIDKLRLKHNIQQKEFISYLEDGIKLQEKINDKLLATAFEEILTKYKEIIGDIEK